MQGNERDQKSVVLRLIPEHHQLPEQARAKILAQRAATVPALLQILEDEALAGWAPVHAVRLLGEMQIAEAVGPMLRALAETDPLDLLHDAVLVALPKLGAPIVEPALRAYTENADPEFRVSIGSILARVGVRDERIFAVLLETLARSPSHAGHLAGYGDARALPHLSRAFDAYKIRDSDSPFANQDIVELEAAIEQLGGTLTEAQSAKYRKALEPSERWRRQVNVALSSRKSGGKPTRPGRNEPCWCNSAKKYKQCHLAADQDVAGKLLS
jgi:HEAT repeat protein